MLYYSVLTCSSLETHCMYNQIHYANPDCARNSWQQKLNCCIGSESHSDSSTLPSSLCTYQTSHTLWSSGEQLLKILKFLGECSFTFIAPSVWSLVPASVWDLHTLSSKPSSRLSSLDKPFHKPIYVNHSCDSWDYMYACVGISQANSAGQVLTKPWRVKIWSKRCPI